MSDLLRVSCSGLCRIQNNVGDYLLAYNRNMLKKGQKVYKPIGGVLHFLAPDVPSRFNALKEREENDLRLHLKESHLPVFREWFQCRQEREISPFRELQEELVSELEVFTSLESGDVKIDYLCTHEVERFTDRENYTGVKTINFNEIFQVEFLSPEHQMILDAIIMPEKLAWISPEEIQQGHIGNTSIEAKILLA